MTPTFPSLNFPTLPQMQGLQAPKGLSSFPSFPNAVNGQNLNKVEAQTGYGSQSATNVLDVRPQLQSAIQKYQNAANSLAGTKLNLGRISLNNNFLGAGDFQNQLSNGIDYFGNLGISEGLQNIALQREAANRSLSTNLGRTSGNEGLLSILQNQNLFRSQLAGNPLISQAQKDTAGRVSEQINLENQIRQLKNQNMMQQMGFNQQAQLSELQSRLAAQQPAQNLLEILTNLQGQGRGQTTSESQTMGRNFK